MYKATPDGRLASPMSVKGWRVHPDESDTHDMASMSK
jgi:hypothetical protein